MTHQRELLLRRLALRRLCPYASCLHNSAQQHANEGISGRVKGRLVRNESELVQQASNQV
jgi:hypothetical protein